jgi:hypothetical protein
MTPRVLWMLVIFVAACGYGLVYQPAERTARESARDAQELYREAVADESVVQRAARLRVVQARLDNDIARLGGEGSSGAVTAAALRVFGDDSRRFDLDVRNIAPVDAGAAPATRDPLIAMPVTLGVRGRFRNLIALLSDLPRHEVLIGVDDVAFTAHENNLTPLLDATVHLTIYRLEHVHDTEGPHVAGTL